MLLEVTGLKASYARREVLHGIDLAVDKGDVVAVIGPSGSGKTTLLRTLNFLEPADAGSLSFAGESHDMAHMKRADILAIRRRTAFVFQNYNIFLNKTALENITEGLVVGRGMNKTQARERALALLSRFGLSGREDAYPSELSGGQQQRVAIARALAPGRWRPSPTSSISMSRPRPLTPSSRARCSKSCARSRTKGSR